MLDVIYHLIEDNVFLTYINRLFDSSKKLVIIYSSNTDKQARFQAAHVKHRKFSKWIERNKPEQKLIQHIPNRYPHTGNEQKGSFADFYIYERAAGIPDFLSQIENILSDTHGGQYVEQEPAVSQSDKVAY